jgi:hypothetical protein
MEQSQRSVQPYSWRLGYRSGYDRVVLHQTAYSFRGLRAVFDPVFNAVMLEVNRHRLSHRIVMPNHFNGPAVAGAFLVDYYQTVGRFLFRPETGQSNH